MILTIVAGARPNFMKVAPIIKAIHLANKAIPENIKYRLVHTGQHYDNKMSGVFFNQLGIPKPDANLGAGGGTQAEQTASIMISFEKELSNHRPDVVLVVGDVTSTMACTITAKKMCIDVVHVEAGIRSGDMRMPEEINRILTDSICDHFFTTTELANSNLSKSGIPEDRIHLVGNTMIDTLYQNIDNLIQPPIWEKFNLKQNEYFLVTLHRPANVDDSQNLKNLLDGILRSSYPYPVLFPVHPRTRKVLEEISYEDKQLMQMDPLAYLEFIYLVKNARCVITDSGGIAEETTALDIPCITLRDSTERPETISIGTNELVGLDPNNISPYIKKLNNGEWKKGGMPEMWDGKTSSRIINKLLDIYG
ncbi:non-hydrolyzing UDP-N-acetylglucosamine 2-epimerase [Muriicola sp. Z0-33]|uniref:non-hydrolyzing UDP-N-acetylglucosamine 2-epimerase n=1 Tax=Muriicola sp. Z0-33 TaxID=2816957 RepID=UPI0022376322|nr:UDP-N-acetylglucosamine 2-epimerase (non-hydrolyzing) [Muriicola sp. Z0-33]MCW5517993.1 UDP-N-acetylglucosamine 2-epimerase (non-hydrolyzing) [Muriicola sp. Z0-33]